MARKFTGIRGLGNMEPQLRSALLNLSRSVKSLSQEQRGQVSAGERSVARGFGSATLRGPSAGGKPTVTTFGLDIDKPTTQRLLERGVGAFIYIAQDTNKVYMWTGTAYKSATFT